CFEVFCYLAKNHWSPTWVPFILLPVDVWTPVVKPGWWRDLHTASGYGDRGEAGWWLDLHNERAMRLSCGGATHATSVQDRPPVAARADGPWAGNRAL